MGTPKPTTGAHDRTRSLGVPSLALLLACFARELAAIEVGDEMGQRLGTRYRSALACPRGRTKKRRSDAANLALRRLERLGLIERDRMEGTHTVYLRLTEAGRSLASGIWGAVFGPAAEALALGAVLYAGLERVEVGGQVVFERPRYPARPCVICGKPYRSPRRPKVTCGPECQAERKRRYQEEYKRAAKRERLARRAARRCSVCGRAFKPEVARREVCGEACEAERERQYQAAYKRQRRAEAKAQPGANRAANPEPSRSPVKRSAGGCPKR